MLLRELPWPGSPAAWYSTLRRLPWPCWLDSGAGPVDERRRWHIMVAAPRWRVIAREGLTQVADAAGRVKADSRPPLEVIRALLDGRPPPAGLPFAGGAVGYLSYDHGRRLMGLPVAALEFPEVAVGIYDWAILLDRREARAWLAGAEPPHGLVAALERAARRAPAGAAHWRLGTLRQPINRESYGRAFVRIQHYLREGDCYQVNYAQPFETAFQGDPLAFYLHLRACNPVSHGGFLAYPFGWIASLSPEQFVRLAGDRVITRPIKGTRPRDADAVRDRELAAELEASEKDRAENLMIVDLLRNDLGRVCRPGTIAVPELFQVESLANVHHLVSTITGRLQTGLDGLDLLEAVMPGGSITGAPKRRAMEIIDELEGRPRESYCGTLFWLDHGGDLDSNIAIRTFQCAGGRMRYWAGGGIVADSRERDEYQESLHKAAPLLQLFPSAGEGR